MNNNGWIKLHRKIIDKGYYKNSKYVHLWIHLLLLANHKINEFMWNGNMIVVKEGQFITGREQLSKDTGIPSSSVERILKMLENEHQIEQQKTTKYRLITIVNWKDHQKADSTSDNKRTTNGQQTDTNKNDNNEKNDKKGNIASDENKNISEFIDLFKVINPTYKVMFGRPNQREASARLLKLRPIIEWKAVVEFISRHRVDKYCPRISNPLQLEQKYADLETYGASLKIKPESKYKVAFT